MNGIDTWMLEPTDERCKDPQDASQDSPEDPNLTLSSQDNENDKFEFRKEAWIVEIRIVDKSMTFFLFLAFVYDLQVPFPGSKTRLQCCNVY